jgi:hypothetical protein
VIDKLLLALRNDGHRVSVIRREGETRVQLGVRHPDSQADEQERRARVLRQWGTGTDSPRREAPATIDEPLPQRTQTILSYRVDPALRQRLDSGTGLPAQSRTASRAAPRADADLDPDPS